MLIIEVVSFVYLICKEGVPNYNYRNLLYGYGTASIGVIFYFLGTDIDNDYARWKHGVWHIILGSPCHFIWQAQVHGDDYYTLKEIVFGKKKLKKEGASEHVGKKIIKGKNKKNKKNS